MACVSTCVCYVLVYPVCISCMHCVHMDGVFIPMRVLLFNECVSYVCAECVFKLCAWMHMPSVYLLHVSVWTGPDHQTLGLEGQMAHLRALGW